jgi:hypothetical protein
MTGYDELKYKLDVGRHGGPFFVHLARQRGEFF